MILEATNIVKSFGKKKILNGLSFSLDSGGIYGIVGENGSGKSTLLKSLIGYYKIDKGEIIINGSFGYCPQHPVFFQYLTIKEHFKYFCAAYNIDINESEIYFLLEHLNFRKYLNEKIAHLSGGTLQKLNLAISLLNNPDLLILDEPYNGFDWETYLKFWELTEILKARNTTILIVTHFINEKERFNKLFNITNGLIE